MPNSMKFLDVPGKMTEVSLVLPPTFTYEEWREAGQKLAKVKEWSNWAIGDWLCWGEAQYGETYAQAATELGISPDRLMILKHVSNAVPVLSRNKRLSWSHHKEVAKLPVTEQGDWLSLSVANDWSVADLKKQLEDIGLRRRRKGEVLEEPRVTLAREAEAETALSLDESCPVCEGPGAVCSVCPDCLGLLAQLRSKTVEL